MILFYNLSVWIYSKIIRIVSPFNKKAKLWVAGRRKIFNRIKSAVKPDERIIWFHAASLGEFEQGRPVIEELKKRQSDVKIFLTFFSPSGYEIRKNYEAADYVFYLPIDSKRNAKRFLDLVKPEAALFIKYEYWYHFLNELKRVGVPTYIFSAIFRKNQPFFKFYGGMYRRMLKNYTHIFVQNNYSKELLQTLGIENVSVTGDTRFDRVCDIAMEAKELSLVKKFKQNCSVLIAGSTWQRDEEHLITYINESEEPHKYIVAPHEIDEEHVRRIEDSICKKVVRYTKATEQNVADVDVLVVDCIGILSSLYRYGEVSYIGGGFGKGIHNTLEAATFGLPVIFGPNFGKFQEAKDLISLGAAFSYSKYDELKNLLNSFWKDEKKLSNSGNAARKYVEEERGASEKILLVISGR